MSATVSVRAGTLDAMNTVIERAAADRIAAALAREACAYGDPAEPEHDHAACLDAPAAPLAEHLWRIVTAVADGNGKAARVAVRRLDQAMGAGEIR